MATITVPSDPTLPVAGAEIKAPPLKDWITNIRTFLESTSIDEGNVDTSGTDGIVGKSIAQTITGLKTFSSTAAAAGGLREVAKFEINPVSGTPAANDGLRMTFTADDAGGAATAIGYLDLKMTDASASSEDSEWRVSTIANAASVTPLVVNSTAITMTTGTVAVGTNATVGGTLVVTGGGTFGSLTVGSAAISEAELEMLDGITPGTIVADKAVVVNSNKDASDFRDVGARNIILTGELDAVTLDISGNADIDGTLEADAITLGGTALGSLYSPIAGGSSIVTTGALNSGSITSGFGTIDTGSSTITTTGVVTAGGLTIGAAVVDETELEILDGATVTTAELNILDGVTSTAAELNILDGVTSTATEINLLDALDRGSILYGNASGVTAVLGQGGAGTVLTSNGTDISWGSAGGTGDFSGPGSSSNNAIVRFDGTGGKTGQDSSVLIDDSNNITGAVNITLSGELDAATLDISGNADIDGTLEADAITLGGTALGSLYSPIAGSSSIATVGTVTAGAWESSTVVASAYLDAQTAHLNVTQSFTGAKTFGAATQFNSSVTVGVDDAGYDVIFYGNAASANATWDASADDLILSGAAGLIVPDGQLTLGATAVTSTAAELNILDGVTSTAAEINLLDALDRGSIIYGNASSVTTVLGQGGAGTVLTSDGTDISWAAATGGHTIQEEGSGLTQRTKLNFVGAAVTATDGGGVADSTIVTVTATGASLPLVREADGSSDPITLTSAAVGESLVSDTSPQLGGSLDVNGQSIVSDSGNENIPITPHGTGSVVISKADINGGAIDATAIGAGTPSTIAGTTIDATTDFTIGSTIITDGVITDSSGLSIVADTTIANGYGVVVGGATQVNAQGITSELQVTGTGDADASMIVARYSADAGPPRFQFVKSRGASIGSNGIVQDGDPLGDIVWFGNDGGDNNNPSASIRGAVDGTPGADDTPGRLMFMTTADGAASQVERMRITDAADGAAGNGTDFTNSDSNHVVIHGLPASGSRGISLRYDNGNDNGTIDAILTGTVWKPLSISANANVTICGASGTLTVGGAMTKGSGSFRIRHPLESRDGYDLVHSFIEGPQADLLYRGTATLSGGTATVNIDTAARMTDGTFVALVNNVQAFTTNETAFDNVRASVSGNVLTITSEDNTSTASISWLVVGERKDAHMLETEWTDSDGRVITEPETIPRPAPESAMPDEESDEEPSEESA